MVACRGGQARHLSERIHLSHIQYDVCLTAAPDLIRSNFHVSAYCMSVCSLALNIHAKKDIQNDIA